MVMVVVAIAICSLSSVGETKVDDAKPGDTRPARVETYQVFYLIHANNRNDLNDIQTDLRNMLPNARIYGVPTQNAISVQGTQEELSLAQKIISDLDRAAKLYRLTYIFTEKDGSKQTIVQHYSMIVVSGVSTVMKQGSRVPIVTGGAGGSKDGWQTQYLDVGLNIEATFDGVRLKSKVEQSSVSEEKSGVGLQDPVISQTMLEGSSILPEGKPVLLGVVDVPGSTRRQEIEVVAEVVR